MSGNILSIFFLAVGVDARGVEYRPPWQRTCPQREIHVLRFNLVIIARFFVAIALNFTVMQAKIRFFVFLFF